MLHPKGNFSKFLTARVYIELCQENLNEVGSLKVLNIKSSTRVLQRNVNISLIKFVACIEITLSLCTNFLTNTCNLYYIRNYVEPALYEYIELLQMFLFKKAFSK